MPHKEEYIIAKFSQGLGKFDQHYGYPQIDNQETYKGVTGKVVDIQGIQAHAGQNFFVPEGKKFSLDIDQYACLHIAIKAEPGTSTCLFLLVHEKEHDWNRRFVSIGKTSQGDCRYHLMSNYFTIEDDNNWHDYVYDLRKIREEKDNNVYHQPLCPDAGSIRKIQFYAWTGSGTHVFNFNLLKITAGLSVAPLQGNIHAHAIAQVESSAVGIHLIWMGPSPWVFSPKGWFIQRRKLEGGEKEQQCVSLEFELLSKLRSQRMTRLSIGTITMKEGSWPTQVKPVKPQTPSPSYAPCEVFTLELNEPQSEVKVQVGGSGASFVIALREGKAVATGGPSFHATTGLFSYDLRSLAIDTIIVYTLLSNFLSFCVYITKNEEKEWEREPFIVKNLQLPLQELMPSLHSYDEEFAEGKMRLLQDETLNESEFKRLANILRAVVKQTNPPRPIDQMLLMRENPADSFEEVVALDPIRVLLSHPKWRRVLGFGWFDNDPSLVAGETYEYRITGFFPVEDLADAVYGFHTIPSKTALPAEFYLRDMRIRLPQPTTVERAPDTPGKGLVQISRRGIRLQLQDQHFWLLPSLEDWSLVINFPSPVKSVILELHAEHHLDYAWGAPWAPHHGSKPVPPGPRPQLDFLAPVEQLRLRGRGFLFAIRIPKGPKGLIPVSVTLPPITLQNIPRPEHPILASIRNLQQPYPVQTDDIPLEDLPPRHALGFKVKWWPALRNGLLVWPLDEDAAPPLDASIYQIEHRQIVFQPAFPAEILGVANESRSTRPAALVLPQVMPRLSPELIKDLQRVNLSEGEREKLMTGVVNGDLETIINLSYESATAWEPVLTEENWTMGDRDKTAHDTQVHHGVDLMTLFPEVPRRAHSAELTVYWHDVFDFEEGGNTVRRPVPLPGTYHQYRVCTVDPIGRPSLTWRETNIMRLEKRLPPPLPVGPDETRTDKFPLPIPIGVQARVLVKHSQDLTTDDRAILGTDDNNVTILRWGWHQQQRNQDPFAREFRIYVADKPLDAVSGTLTYVVTLWLGIYNVTLNLDRAVFADAAKDSNLHAGYPFYIKTHTAGSVITAILEARVPGPDGSLPEPALGPILLPLHLTPNLTRPPAWSERVEVQPITVETHYQAIIRNRLSLTPTHSRDSIWVGVSVADDQPYVPDQLAPQLAPEKTRPGNESAIVPVLCEGRYHGRPEDFGIPPALDPVPILVTPEPADRPIFFSLDLSSYLTGTGLTHGDLIRPERVSADAVFAAYYVTVDSRIMARVVDKRSADETDVEVIIANPNDRAEVIAALKGARTDALEDRFVVFLAGSHCYRDRLFEPATLEPVLFGAFQETLPLKSGRYVYRVRKSDAAGHLSAGDTVAKVIIRVPSMAPGAAPEKSSRENSDAPGTLRLRIAPDPDLSYVLIFKQVATNKGGPVGEADVLRVPNRPDLYPNNGIRLRTPDGAILAPQVKTLSDADVTLDTDGFRRVILNFNAGPGERLRVWACTLTCDGIPSLLAGPWSLAMPLADLPTPTLIVTGIAPNLLFTWSWLSDSTYNVALECSPDGTNWERVSPPLAETATTYTYTQHKGGWQYRLRVMSPDGRTTYSNMVIP